VRPCLGFAPRRLIAVVLLGVVGSLMWAAPAMAHLSSGELEKMPEIVEWFYRNSSVKDPVSCAEVCKNLWTDEQGLTSGGEAEQALWEGLGTTEISTGLWEPLGEFEFRMGGTKLGVEPFVIGWHMEGVNPKWLAINQSPAPEEPDPECPAQGEFYEYLEQPGTSLGQGTSNGLPNPDPVAERWTYVAYSPCGSRAIANYKEPPSNECTTEGVKPPPWRGWFGLEYATSFCESGSEILFDYMIAIRNRPFHFARPEDYTGQTGAKIISSTDEPSNPPGPEALESALKVALEEPEDAALNEWLVYHLTGEGRDPTANLFSAEEQFGSGSEAERDRKKCEVGHPVNCATGNQVVTQADLAVGGRGPALALSRTYNSQLAVSESTPGSFGYGWTSSYSAHLVVNTEAKTATVHQDNGSTVPFREVAAGRYEPGNPLVQATLGKEGSEYVYTLPDQTKLDFNSAGRLSSETARDGNATTLSYNGSGELEAITDPVGRKITLSHNSEGLIESATDPMGHTVKYTYEGGNLASVTLPGETSPHWRFKYNSSHELTSETNGLEHTVTSEYNSSHQVIAQTDAMDRTRTWRYNATEPGSETLIHEPNGSQTLEFFEELGQPTSVKRAYDSLVEASTAYVYNSADELAAVVDPDGHKTEYGYDSAGDRTSEKDADGDETKWTYDSTHDLQTMTTPKGETTTIKREAHGNPEVIERPAPGGKTQLTRYKYTSHGELESVTNPLEHTWKYEYDTKGDRTAETDPEGNKRTWEYNEDSQETATVSPRGNIKGAEPSKFTTKIERDAQGRPLKITDPLGHTTEYKYDADGNIEKLTDGNKHTTTYTYNSDDEPIKVEEPNKAAIETEYDAAGQVVAQIDGNKHRTKYNRNALEEVTEVTDPLGHVTTKEYDAAGNLVKLTDPTKRTTTYTYDPANRLKEVSYSSGKPATIKYEYDKDGDCTKIIDGTGTTTYTYDQLDRLTESENGHKEVVKYEYDLADDETKITYPNKKAVSRAFDKDGRLEKVTDWLEHSTKFVYDEDSDLTDAIFPSETKDEDKSSYNDADQMSEVTIVKSSETLASLVYTRDNDGQVKKTTAKKLPGAEVTENTYDENNRLTKYGSTEYKYDAANNPTTEGSSTNTYNEDDELEKGTGASYSYDELGERTKNTPGKGPATTYGYNQAGELTAVERPKEGEIAKIEDSYTYDGNGLRATQTISGTTTYLAWDMAEELPLILNDGTNSFIYGPGGLPIEQITTGGTPTYLHHDQAGSTRLLTGSAGTVTGKCTYTAYGTPTCEGTTTTPLGYDAQYTSADTGLIYMRARVYDPSTAQFLSVDPLKATTGAPYYYAGDNPLNEADPTGLGNWLNLGIPSPGEVAEKLNPVKYYEEEIESYENGCGYFASVAHGLEGAVVGTLDASGIGGLAEGAAGLAGEEGSTAIEDALAGLEPGSSPGVYTVDSSEELQQIYDELSAGGKPTGSSYPGEEVELSNGTRVGIREASKSGGPTIDINQGGTQYKIHVAE